MAGHADRAPSAAALHARLRQRDLHRLPGAARRPRTSPTTSRSSAAWRASTARPAWCSATRRAATPRSARLRNFGMSRPEGYRKALRLMKLAEKFGLPVFTFVDTPGAYPGIGAEERGQSEAIGRNIFEMAQLEVPIIVTIIGEGGSGGALAISVGDQVLMLQYSIYSVISPEGCASILWKTAERAPEAADALGITAHRLKALGLVDKIVNEPVGGAHRDPKQMAAFLKRALNDALRQVSDLQAEGAAASAATSGCSPTAASATPRRADAAAAAGARRGRLQRRPRFDRAAACDAARRRGRSGVEVRRAARAPWPEPERRRLARALRSAHCAALGASAACRVRVRCAAPGRRAGRGRERRGLGAAGALRGAARDGARRTAPRSCCWPITGATRPRRCCCRRCAAPASAGPRGMPRGVERDGIDLGAAAGSTVPREAIDAYVRRHRLAHVEDDSNADPRFARNRLRAAGLAGAGRGLSAGRGGAGRRRCVGAGGERAASTSSPRSTWRASRRDERPAIARLARAVAGTARATRCAPGCARGLGRRRRRRSSQRLLRRAAGAAPARAGRRRDGELRSYRGAAALRRCRRLRRARAARPTRASICARRRCTRCRAGAARLQRRRVDARRRAAGAARPPRPARRARGGEQLPGRHRPAAAQPEEAVPGGRRRRRGSATGRSSTAAVGWSSCRASASMRARSRVPGEPQVDARLASRLSARDVGRATQARRLESRFPARVPASAAPLRTDSPMALIVHKYGGTSMGSTGAHPQRRQARRQMGARRAPDGRRARRR